MDAHQLKIFDHSEIPNIVTELELPDAAQAIVKDQVSDINIVNALIENSLFNSAIRFLALGLPKRQAVWWAYLAAAATDGNSDDLHTQNALRLTEDWVKKPEDEKRYSAKKLADILELYTPASWAAMAVFWSGDNIAPKGRPAAAPGIFMCGHAAANAVVLAAEESQKPLDQIKLYLKQGLHIAMGGNGNIEQS